MHRLLLALLIIGLVGMGAEPLLLRHTETLWELIPLVLFGWSLVTLAWLGISRGRGSVRALQATMGLFLIAGLAGFALHYLSLIHISEPTRLLSISYAVFCLKKKN